MKPREPRPWERQEFEESDLDWFPFLTYRDLEPDRRTLIAVSAKHDWIQLETLGKLAARNLWRDRVRAYDAWVDRQMTRIRLRDKRKFEVRHQELARAAIEASAVELKRLLRELTENPHRMRTLPVLDILRLGQYGVKHERLVRGESTEKVEYDLTGLSTEELRQIQALEEKAAKKT